MGSFNWNGESYTPGTGEGGDFIDAEAFKKLIYTEAVVYITGVREGVSSTSFDGKPPAKQYLVDFVGPDGEEYTKGFQKGNAERDARIARIRDTLAAAPDEPFEASFVAIPNTRGNPRNDIGAPKGRA